jgi:hypothetical protein
VAGTPTAAFPIVVEVAPDSAGSAGTYTAVGGTNNADFGMKNTLVDATYFGGNGAINRFATLMDTDISISGHYGAPGSSGNPSSDTAQNTVMLACMSSSSDRFIWCKFLWDGSAHGPSVKAIPDSFKITGKVADVLTYSFTIKGSGLPVFA